MLFAVSMAPTIEPGELKLNGTTDYPGDNDVGHSHGRFRNLTIFGEALNIFVLVATIWILLCVAVYGIRCKKWLDSQGRMIYFALFGSTLLTLPDAFMVLSVFHLHDIPGAQTRCELLVDLTIATATLSLLATYVFLWLRLRIIYNYKQMRVLYRTWVRYVSCGLLVALCACLIGLAVIDIIPLSTMNTDAGCVYSVHTNASDIRLLSWNTVRGLELAVTTLVQIAFLSLFIYPMVQTRRSVCKMKQSHRVKHDRILAVIKRYTICAAIVIASDIGAEIWIQHLPDGCPAVMRGTICGTDIFIDVLCMVATFADYRIILTVFCRSQVSLSRNDSRMATLARQESSESEKRKISLQASQ